MQAHRRHSLLLDPGMEERPIIKSAMRKEAFGNIV